MNKNSQEFIDRAKLLRHNVSELEKGVVQEMYFTIDNVEDGRKILSMATSEQRKKRQETFFSPSILLRCNLGLGFHDRAEAYFFADGDIPEKDKEVVDRYFPLHARSMSIPERVIRRGEIWDVTATGERWGIKREREVYNILNIGRLKIEVGGKLQVRGNVFSLLCQELIVESDGSQSNEDYHIGILPTPFPVDLRNGPFHGEDGENGQDGMNGRDGAPPFLENTILGPILRLPTGMTMVDRNGCTGTSGTSGTPGSNGRNGGICRIAEITVRHLEGKLKLFSQPGQGGNGGNGGCGGNGGNGGHGANGARHLKGVLLPGSGGNGGDAGDGSRGGNGGNGGISSNIYVNVPSGSVKAVHCLSLPAAGGRAGLSGRAGLPGRGGKKGCLDNVASEAKDGNDGLPGKESNITPKPGRQREAPDIYVNEVLFLK